MSDLTERLRLFGSLSWFITSDDKYDIALRDANMIVISGREAADEIDRLTRELAEAREALRKINDIRNSIIGCQTVNWSEHIYPLVAALNEAGIEGQPYPEAREYVGTMLERTLEAEKEAEKAARVSRKLALALQPLARLELNYSSNNPSDAVFARGCVYVSDVRQAAAAIRALKEKP